MTYVLCVDCISRVSVSCVLLAVEILRKDDKVSQVKCCQKTILIGLSIFRLVGEKSVHGRPSWEFTKHCNEDFAAWCKHVSKECRFNDRVGN